MNSAGEIFRGWPATTDEREMLDASAMPVRRQGADLRRLQLAGRGVDLTTPLRANMKDDRGCSGRRCACGGGSRRPASSRISASCGTRAGTFGGPGSFAKSLPTTSHSGSSAPSPGNDLLKLRWKPEVRVSDTIQPWINKDQGVRKR